MPELPILKVVLLAAVVAVPQAVPQPEDKAGTRRAQARSADGNHDASKPTKNANFLSRRWTLISNGDYEIVTDAGSGPARRAAERVDAMAAALQMAGGRRKPMCILLLQSANDYAQLKPAGASQAFYQSGAAGDWIAVNWAGVEPLRALAHELVHASLEYRAQPRPLWLEEGTADYFSTIAPARNGWLVGTPVPGHLAALRTNQWIPASEMFSSGKDSKLYDEASRIGIFYAQSWALLHMLQSARGYREHLPEFLAALDASASTDQAARQAFHSTAQDLLAACHRYVDAGRFATVTVAGAESAVEWKQSKLDAEEARVRIASLALAVGHPAVAESIYRNDSAPPASLGELALARGDSQAAALHFEKAISEGTGDAVPYLELAMLKREQGAEPEAYRGLLTAALERDGSLAEAHLILGQLCEADKDLPCAIAHFTHAAELLPRQATFWHALAMALHYAGRKEEAMAAAQRARGAARNEQERQMAAAAMDAIK